MIILLMSWYIYKRGFLVPIHTIPCMEQTPEPRVSIRRGIDTSLDFCQVQLSLLTSQWRPSRFCSSGLPGRLLVLLPR